MFELVRRPLDGRDTDPLPRLPGVAAARERALAFIVDNRGDTRASADGRGLGVQARLSRDLDGTGAIALDELVDGLVFDPAVADDELFVDDPLGAVWRTVADEVREKLGFPLEPELFSNMLVVGQLSGVDSESAQATVQALLRVFRDTAVDGLYHFFSSLRFACDTDCTGIGIRARLLAGDLPLDDPGSRIDLRRSTDRLLGSAAVADIPREENRSHGKDNGPLLRHVIKVYLDDHRTQGPEHDRGLKHDAVVASNALYPILAELKAGLRSAREPVALFEYPPGGAEPRTGVARVADIVAANVRYVTDHLVSGAWRHGTRYYRSPDAFLCFFSELAAEFGELFVDTGAVVALRRAIVHRRRVAASADPIDVALRGIAAANADLDPYPEQARLVETQRPTGDWPGFGALYSFGSTKVPRVFFGAPVVTAAFAVRALSPTFAPLVPVPDHLAWSEPLRGR